MDMRSIQPIQGKRKKSKFAKHYALFLFVVPALLYVLVFSYLPMYGIVIAFQDFSPVDDILSPNAMWIGFDNFTRFFENYKFWTLMENTFLLCIYGFVIGFPLPIIVALMLNAMKGKKLSRRLQTIFYAPHFISVIVMVGMLYLFFGEYGLVNNIIRYIGGDAYSYFLESEAFRPLYILSSNWQDFGWSSIIYLAALSGVDPQLHEAAVVDGASRFQRIIHIDFPAIFPTVSMLLILSIGNLMSVGYEKALLMQTGANLATSEIVATYVYRIGFVGSGEYGYATAIGLFNALINVILLVFANTMSRRFSKNSLW
jgi:putative aldouronate transport system permease protein